MMPHDDRPIYAVVALTGISALVSQLLIMRECIAQFAGNELVIALILFTWLLLGGAGNRLAQAVHRRILPATQKRLARLSMVLAAFPPFQIFAIRWLRNAIFVQGSEPGFYATLLFIFLTMAPYALLAGIALPYGLLALGRGPSGSSGTRIYMADNLGNIIGGVLFTFALVKLPGPSWSVLVTGLVLLAGALFLFLHAGAGKRAALCAGSAVLAVLISGLFLEKPSLRPASGTLEFYKESRYGRITVVKDRELHTVFADGNPVFTDNDIIAAEEAVHYPLSQIPVPDRILFVSAQPGMMAEIRKYGRIAVDYVEFDPDISDVLLRFNLLGDESAFSRIIHMDARRYLADTQRTYDAVIVNLPDPDTFQVNRFFTDRFFSLVKARLTPGGIFSFHVPGYDSYLAAPLRRKISCLHNTVSDYFSHVVLIPGNRIFFLCRDRDIDTDIPGRLDRKGIATRYVGPYYPGNVTPERLGEIRTLLDYAARKNKDLHPYLIRLMMDQWFAVHHTSPTGFVAGAALLLIAVFYLIGRAEFVLFTTGFAVMGSEILTVLAVQIFFGHIYHRIGLLVAVFLAGLIPGAWAGRRWVTHKKALVIATDALFILLMPAFILTVSGFGGNPPPLFFWLFGLAVSLVCGCQFSLVLDLIPDKDSAAIRSFSSDMAGAAFGVLLTGVVLIPWVGIPGAAWGLAGLKCLSLGLFMLPGLKG